MPLNVARKYHSWKSIFVITMITMSSFAITGCSLEVDLAKLLSEKSDFEVTSDSGPINTDNHISYHVRGRCPVESSTVEFTNTNGTLPCIGGIFDGYLDLSGQPDGALNIYLLSSDGKSSTWKASKDTQAPIVFVGLPVFDHTGLNRSISIPVSFSDASAINMTNSNIAITGTGVNNCSVAISGPGTTSRTLTLSNCDQATGNFTVGISAGVAIDSSGNSSLASNLSSTIYIDNVPPMISETLTSVAIGNNTTTFSWQINVTGADAISLTSADVLLTGASAGCAKSLTGTGLTQKILEITGCTGNGSLQVSIPSGSAKDLALNPSAVLDLTPVNVDNQAPTLTLQTPTPLSGNSATTFSWILDITGANSVNIANGDITLLGTTAGCSVAVSGTGLTQRTVQVSGCTGTGILAIKVNAGVAGDAGGNLSLASADSAPVSLSNAGVGISLSGPTPGVINAAGSSTFTITYSNATTYTLTTADISLTGATTSCSKNLSGTGPSFTLTVTNCSGNGNVQMSVAASTANNGAGSYAPAAGPSANLRIDNILPSISVAGPTPTTGRNTTSFTWTLNFTDANTVSLASNDITLSGANAGCVASVAGAGLTSRTITVTGCTGNGLFDLALPAGVLVDAGGNSSISMASLGSVTIDNLAPTITMGSPSPTTGTVNTTFNWPVTIAGAQSVSIGASDVSLTTALTGCTVNVTGTGLVSRNIAVSNCAGDGPLRISINAAVASDPAGNTNATSAPSNQVVVDNTAPVINIGSPAPSAGNSSTNFSWPLTFTGADFVSLSNSHITLVGATTGCTVSVSSSGTTSGTVNVTNCSGTGALQIRVTTGAVEDFAGNANTTTANSTAVSISNGTPAIQVTGLPLGHNNINSVTTVTSGPSLISYVFKIGPTASTDCSVATGYSTAQALGNYTHDLSSFGNVEMAACFKGQDAFGTASAIVRHQWSRDASGGNVGPFSNICGNPPQLTNNLSTTTNKGILVDSGDSTSDYLRDNEVCLYTITTGAPITMNLDFFESEGNYDFLEVYDGTTSDPQLARISGTHTGESYTATSGTMTLKWTTDSSVTKPGFIMSWGGATATGSDLEPDDFALSNVVNGSFNTVYTRTFAVNGISEVTYAGIDGFDSAIRNDTAGSSWDRWITVQNGDTVSIRMTSGANSTQAQSASLRIGTLDKIWKIYWDAIAPTGTIQIAGGAANSTTVATTLDLTVVDSSNGPLQVYITQDASCNTGGVWQIFDTNPPWTLQDESAVNTVYVRYRDEAGNISSCYSDTIQQDNQAAPVAVLSSTSPTNTNAASVPMTITFNEPVTGLTASDFVLVNATISSLAGSGKVYTASILPQGPGPFSAQLPAATVKDYYNNDSTASNTLSWFFDTIGPGITLATSSLNTKSSFEVIVYTNDPGVTSFPTNGVTVTNATVNFVETKSNGVVTWFVYSVNPISEGNVNVYVAAGVVTDPSGNPNTISNTLSVNYFTPPLVQFDSGYSIINESNTSEMGYVSLSIQNPKPYSFDVKLIRNVEFSTAIPGTHHDIPAVTTLTIPANATSAGFSYNITGDTVLGGNQTVLLSLTADFGAIEMGSINSHRILIRDDEDIHIAPKAFEAESDTIVTIDSNDKLKIIGSDILVSNSLYVNSQKYPATIDAANNYRHISVGDDIACAVTTTGVLKCWGFWSTDGNGASTAGFLVRDAGVSYKSIYVSRYDRPICGITSTDHLRCYGYNSSGQLLTGNTDFQTSFVDVDMGRTYKQFAATNNDICAITTANQLYCWGKNQSGESGVGSFSPVSTPTLVDAGTGYKLIKASWGSFCGITTTDKLKCWGGNSGLLGTGGFSNTSTPTSVDGSEDYQDVVMDMSLGSCALTLAGELKCWGYIYSIIDGGNMNPVGNTASTPMNVQFGKTFQRIAGRGTAFCALRTDGNTICTKGILDNFSYSDSQTLKPASFGDTWAKLEPGYNLACGLTNTGLVKCNSDYNNAIGDGYSGIGRYQYLPVASSRTFIDLSVRTFACAISSEGELYCWGPQSTWNPYSGNPNNSVMRPSLVQFAPKNLKKVYTSNAIICVIDNNDDLFCKGRNDNGSLGNNSNVAIQDRFVRPATSEKFQKVSIVDSAVCGLTLNSKVMCWGNQPGNGSTGSLMPVYVDAANNYIDISVNLLQKCGVTSGNVLKCWGKDDGSIGENPTYGDILNPVVVDSGTSYKKVNTHYQQSSTCGITTSDQLKCMGWSPFSSAPTVYDSGTTYSDTVGFAGNVCAKTTANTYKCWGNSASILGTGKPTAGFTIVPKSY